MTPLLLACSLCLPAHVAPGAPRGAPPFAQEAELRLDLAGPVGAVPDGVDGLTGGADGSRDAPDRVPDIPLRTDSSAHADVPRLDLTAGGAGDGAATMPAWARSLREAKGDDDAVSPPPSWESWTLVGSMGAFALGGNALAATRGFNIGRLVIDEASMVVGSTVGIAGTLAASFLLGPKEGGLLLPLSERKLFTVLLLGGIVGSIGALAAAEAIGGHLDHPIALLGGAGGFIITSSVIIGLVDGIFGLPVWANAVMLPLGLVGGTIGGYSLAIPR